MTLHTYLVWYECAAVVSDTELPVYAGQCRCIGISVLLSYSVLLGKRGGSGVRRFPKKLRCKHLPVV